MSKHTPGPWIEVGRYIETDGHIICEMFSAGSREKRDANQRLIAAAPELLGTLKEIGEFASEPWVSDAARRAIAKATGEDEACE